MRACLYVTCFVLFCASSSAEVHGVRESRSACGTDDLDCDGISDTWENSRAGKALGATTSRKDVFFHVDWEYCASIDSGNPLRKNAVKYITRFFRDRLGKESWCAHIDNGLNVWSCDDLSPDGKKLTANPQRAPFAEARMVGVKALGLSDQVAYDTLFPKKRAKIFHYAVRGCDGGGQSTPGDLLVGFGGQYEQDAAEAMLHEFGHKFGLRHGGLDEVNYKPNYVSLMNYAYMYHDVGLSHELALTLNEFAVCEKKGLGITLFGKKVGVGGYTVPIELYPLVAYAGVPSRSVSLLGGVDWNGDGVISDCSSGISEANVEPNFGDFPLVKDSSNLKADTHYDPTLASIKGSLWAFYAADANGKLMAAKGPASLQAYRDQLMSNKSLDMSAQVFGAAVALDYPAAYGIPTSGFSALSDVEGDDARVYFATKKNYVLGLRLGLSGSVLKTKGIVILNPGGKPAGETFCDPAVAYDAVNHHEVAVVRDCATGKLFAWRKGKATPLVAPSAVKPGLAIAPNGDAFAFGAWNGDSAHPCGSGKNRLYVVPFSAEKVQPPKWVWDPSASCKHDAAGVGGSISAIFDNSKKRSLDGRIYIYYRRTQPKTGSSYRLVTVHYDLRAQNEPLGLKAIVGNVHGPMFDWGEFVGDPKGFSGAATTASGMIFNGRAAFVFVLASLDPKTNLPLKDHGRLIVSPSADGVSRNSIAPANDEMLYIPGMMKTIGEMPIPAGATGSFVTDGDGDGIPDSEDECRHYAPAAKTKTQCKDVEAKITW